MFHIAWKHLNPVVTYANVLQCEPEFTFGPRMIYEHQFIYVVKGKGTATIQSNHYEAREGDLFYYGPHIVHTFKADKKDPFQVYGMHIVLYGTLPDPGEYPPITLNVEADYKSRRQNLLIIQGGALGPFEVPEYSHPGSSGVQTLFNRIVRQYSKADAVSPLLNRALVIEFLIELQQHSVSIMPRPPRQDQSVMYVKAQLEMRAELPYSRAWLKEWTRYNEDYIARNFREQFGLSPHEYHMQLKIDRAKEWLAFTDMSVTEIAERLHIGTVHYFSRRFKTKTGYTPTDYRSLRRMI